jgi:hypothetical protein
MKKSILVAAAVMAFALAGCGGSGSPSPRHNTGQTSVGTSNSGGGGSSKSPYQQQKEENEAAKVCSELDNFSYNQAVISAHLNLGFSNDEAIQFVKKAASQQCPEVLATAVARARDTDNMPDGS